MSHESLLVAPRVVVPSETVVAPVEEAPLPCTSVEVPRPEQVRAVEAVFTHQDDKETHLVGGLLGMWTATMLLHDLTVEHLSPPTNEEPVSLDGDDEDDEER